MTLNHTFLISVGKRIDEIRRTKGISFQELAYRSEMEKANLVRLTSHGTNITINTLYNISEGLGVPLKELFDYQIPSEKHTYSKK